MEQWQVPPPIGLPVTRSLPDSTPQRISQTANATTDNGDEGLLLLALDVAEQWEHEEAPVEPPGDDAAENDSAAGEAFALLGMFETL